MDEQWKQAQPVSLPTGKVRIGSRKSGKTGGSTKQKKRRFKMKKTILFAVVLVLVGASQCFGGAVEKCVSRGMDAVGLGDTVLREAGSEKNEAVNAIREVTRPVGIVASAKDAGMLGTTAAVVSGSSGPAIMSTMAAIGKPVAALTGGAFGATISGTAIVASSAGLGAAGILNEFVFDGDTAGNKAARVGTYAGALGATAGGVATVAAAGTVGLSAAGIASGLATIGGVVGGGMAAGTIIVVAAPVAAAAAIGGLVYWLFSD
jgi:hypothetical protein